MYDNLYTLRRETSECGWPRTQIFSQFMTWHAIIRCIKAWIFYAHFVFIDQQFHLRKCCNMPIILTQAKNIVTKKLEIYNHCISIYNFLNNNKFDNVNILQ